MTSNTINNLLTNLSSFPTYILSFIVLILIIVFIHEFGHYIVAKKCGVKIEAFSIGFGKELFGFFDKSGTRWKICALPFGGYVKMFGDKDPASSKDNNLLNNLTDAEKKVTFHYKPLYQKALIVAAGPLANFLLALILMTFIFNIYGKSIVSATISDVVKDSPAYNAGLKKNDLILGIDNEKINSFADIQQIIALNTGEKVTLEVKRDGQILKLELTPQIANKTDPFGNEIKTPIIGIASNDISYQELSFADAIKESFIQTYQISVTTLKALKQMVIGQRSIKEITGPIGIAKYSGQAAKQGTFSFIWLLVFISINLGLVNLFPIPMLDGGHLLYYVIEAIKGDALADKYQEYGLRFGMVFIILLSIFAILNDIQKLFS